jgi:hypothetical protein
MLGRARGGVGGTLAMKLSRVERLTRNSGVGPEPPFPATPAERAAYEFMLGCHSAGYEAGFIADLLNAKFPGVARGRKFYRYSVVRWLVAHTAGPASPSERT